MTRGLSIATRGIISEDNKAGGTPLGTKGYIFFRKVAVPSTFVYADLYITRAKLVDLHIQRQESMDAVIERKVEKDVNV